MRDVGSLEYVGYRRRIIKKNPTVEDTVRLMRRTSREHRVFKAIDDLLHTVPPVGDILGALEALFWEIDSRTDYRYDNPAREEIKTPDFFLYYDGFGDCDDYSTLWAAFLNRVGIPGHFKIVKYEKGGPWEHVYVTVPFGNRIIVLDNVVAKYGGRFNEEVDHTDSKTFAI